MKLRRKQLCPIHKSFFCCGREHIFASETTVTHSDCALAGWPLVFTVAFTVAGDPISHSIDFQVMKKGTDKDKEDLKTSPSIFWIAR